MNINYNNLIKELKMCNLCKTKFGFEPHPIILENEN